MSVARSGQSAKKTTSTPLTPTPKHTQRILDIAKLKWPTGLFLFFGRVELSFSFFFRPKSILCGDAHTYIAMRG